MSSSSLMPTAKRKLTDYVHIDIATTYRACVEQSPYPNRCLVKSFMR